MWRRRQHSLASARSSRPSPETPRRNSSACRIGVRQPRRHGAPRTDGGSVARLGVLAPTARRRQVGGGIGRESRRRTWSAGISTRTIRTQPGSSIHISINPYGSATGSLRIRTPAAASLSCSAWISRAWSQIITDGSEGPAQEIADRGVTASGSSWNAFAMTRLGPCSRFMNKTRASPASRFSVLVDSGTHSLDQVLPPDAWPGEPRSGPLR